MATEHNTPGASRRSLMAAVLAFPAAVLPAVALPAAALAAEPDAALIRACRDYLTAVAAYNAATDLAGDDDPRYPAILEAEARAQANPPATMAGLAAMANVALTMALMDGTDGEEDWDHGPASHWAAATVKGVLNLFGGETVV